MNPKFEPVMTSGRPAPLPGRTDSLPVDRNSVLRNTYWLLAISLLPVVAGAWLGMQLNFVSFFKAAPIMTPLLMFGAMFGMLFVVSALRNSAWGVAAMLGFTFISGVFLTPILSVAGGLKNGGQLVALAGGMTAAIFFAMATIATVTKRDFSFMGKFLFIGLVLVIVASLANLFFQVPALSLPISAIAVLLFSAYLLFDVSRIVNGGETNYVMATLSIFLSLYNLFSSLLHLLMAFSGERD
mgnify:FL=1